MRLQADSRDAVHSAQGVNSLAGLQRVDDASIGVGREGILVDSGYQDRATCAGVTGCTTTRRKPHGTEEYCQVTENRDDNPVQRAVRLLLSADFGHDPGNLTP